MISKSLFLISCNKNSISRRWHKSAECLSENAAIIHTPTFEKAVVKVQSGNEAALSKNERIALSSFRKDATISNNFNEDSKSNDVELNEFEATFNEMNELKKRKIDNYVSQYISLDYIEATSNAAERLFSRAKLYSSDRRKKITPYHFELLLMLWYNRGLWDVTTIEAAINVVDPINVVQADEDEDEA